MKLDSNLLCVFTAEVSEDGERYTVEIPQREVELGDIDPDKPVKVALHQPQTRSNTEQPSKQGAPRPATRAQQPSTPPVEEGEVRTVTIDHLGDQGDGIAKVDGGFVLIVPGSRVGDEIEVEIATVRDNYAIAEPVSDLPEESSVSEYA